MNNTRAFTEADALFLRAHRPAFQATAKGDFESAPPALRRYFHHYGFPKLLQPTLAASYELGFESWANNRIASHCWRRESARAVVVVVHGLFDHTGLFLRLVERLLREGYEVRAFDLPGHGLSSGTRASIESFHDYTDVLAACVDTQPAGKPVLAVGQSTGCSAVMDLLLTNESGRRIQKAVLLAPLVRAYAWTSIKLTLTLLGRVLKRIPRRFGVNSHDREFLKFLEHGDPLQPRELTTAWVRAMRDWENVFRQAPVADTQVLVIQGTADKTVDWRRNLPLIEHKFARLQTHFVEGAMHHLVGEGEPWRNEVFDSLCAYLADAAPPDGSAPRDGESRLRGAKAH